MSGRMRSLDYAGGDNDRQRTATTMKILILHWFPLEQYPPIVNFLNLLAVHKEFQATVVSTYNDRGLAEYKNDSILVARTAFPAKNLGRVRRIIAFLCFQLLAVWNLLRLRPSAIVYYEPHSSFPAFLYCLLSSKTRLFIHYHEYWEPQHFTSPGMKLASMQHWFERKFLYRRAEWISQTNSARLTMFSSDHPNIPKECLRILPNLPGATWPRGIDRRASRPPCTSLRLLYVGSVSLHDTWIAEVVNWVRHEAQKMVTLDIYTTNCDAATRQFLTESACDKLRFHGNGISYEQLPELMPDFDVGLILYRAQSRNYAYNETNKLYEYLACGLDVWFPPQMVAIKALAREHVRPRILEVDFERIADTQERLTDRSASLRFEAFDRRCDDVMAELIAALKRNASGTVSNL